MQVHPIKSVRETIGTLKSAVSAANDYQRLATLRKAGKRGSFFSFD